MQQENNENKLKSFFTTAGIKQSWFAKRCGISTTQLSSLINGKKGIAADTAVKIIRCCTEIKNEIPDITLDDIVGLITLARSRRSAKNQSNADNT